MKKSHAWPGAGLTAVALSSLLVACGGGEDGPQAVEIQFAAVAAEQPIACNSTVRLGRDNAEATLKDLRFYISNAALLRADGSEVPITLAGNDRLVEALVSITSARQAFLVNFKTIFSNSTPTQQNLSAPTHPHFGYAASPPSDNKSIIL